MPPEVQVAFLQSDDPLLPDVERLFQQMYDGQKDQGLLLRPPPDASERWLTGIRGALGRLGCLVGAVEGGRLVGFLHAGLHVLPEFLGGGLAGRISHVFLSPEVRRRGVGRRMVEAAVEWLRERGADSVEVQVLSQNLSGLAFWEALGWKMELHQMRRPLR
jgi:GNAT superfamily N-acetyltransferase